MYPHFWMRRGKPVGGSASHSKTIFNGHFVGALHCFSTHMIKWAMGHRWETQNCMVKHHRWPKSGVPWGLNMLEFFAQTSGRIIITNLKRAEVRLFGDDTPYTISPDTVPTHTVLNYFTSSDPHHDISKQLVDSTFVWSSCKLDKTMLVLLHQIAAAATLYFSTRPLQSKPIRSHWQSTVSGCLQCIIDRPGLQLLQHIFRCRISTITQQNPYVMVSLSSINPAWDHCK